ncbi:PilW family protein [Pseudomonas sp. F1_0610]|uniref:PilW family protein n=1 Tax=Pseudomonas sp. F1_0610 TaxID=3114284 RepID=UPI0039C28B3A
MNAVLQKGLSLVELMVALAIGMFLVLGIIQVFLTSRDSYSVNEGIARLQENGRFSLDFLTQSLRQAGYIDPKTIDTLPYAIIPPKDKGCSFDTSYCTADAKDTDRISLAFQPPINADGKRYDCAGKVVSDNQGVIINVYTVVETPTETNPTAKSLACKSKEYDGKETITSTYADGILVEGVDTLQIQYGLADKINSESVTRYVSANDVDNWNIVRSVRVAVIVNSSLNSTQASEKVFYLFDNAPFKYNDKQLRQVFTTTVQIKNVNLR